MNDKYEIERKFLIKMPDVEYLRSLDGCVVKKLEQTYLLTTDGSTLRVRRVETESGVTYRQTGKIRISGMKCIEDEREITEEEYFEALKNADPRLRTIKKTRYCIPHGKLTAEIDVYPFWSDKAVAEFELESEDEQFSLPDYITVIKEVTDDVRFKNVRLALELPQD